MPKSKSKRRAVLEREKRTRAAACSSAGLTVTIRRVTAPASLLPARQTDPQTVTDRRVSEG